MFGKLGALRRDLRALEQRLAPIITHDHLSLRSNDFQRIHLRALAELLSGRGLVSTR